MPKTTKNKPNNLKSANKRNKPQVLSPIDELSAIPIYQYLIDKSTADKVIIDLEKLVEEVSSDKEIVESVRASLNALIIDVYTIALNSLAEYLQKNQLCGLQKCAGQIDSEPRSAVFLEKLIQTAEENPESIQSDGGLVEKSHPNHKKLTEGFAKMLDILFSDKSDIVFNSPVLDCLVLVLRALSDSKLRYFRIVAVQLISPIVLRAVKFYPVQQKANRASRANKIKKFVTKIYRQILLQRLKDVDFAIRKKSLSVVNGIYAEVPMDFVNAQQLKIVYGTLLKEDESNIEIALSAVMTLLTKKSIPNKRPYLEFAEEIVETLFQIVITHPKLVSQTLDLLREIQVFSEKADVGIDHEKIDAITVRFASDSSSIYLKYCMKVMLAGRSVVDPDKFVKDLNGKEMPSEMIVRFSPFKELKDEARISIFSAAIKNSFDVYRLQDLFIMLLERSIVKKQSLLDMSASQIGSMACFIAAYMQVAPNALSTEQQIETLTNLYNKTITVSCKEIFYDLIPSNSSVAHSIVRLFRHITMPMSSTLQSYHQLIVNQLLDLFLKTQSQLVVVQLIKALEVISPKDLQNTFDLIHERDVLSLKGDEIAKLAAFLTVSCGGFKTVESMNKQDQLVESLMKSFLVHPELDFNIQLNILSIVHQSHYWRFKLVTQQPREDTFLKYLYLRNELIDWLLSLLKNKEIRSDIKPTVFKILCNNLSLIYSDALSEYFVLHFELSEQMSIIILNYLSSVIVDDQNLEHLFDHMTLEDTNVKGNQLAHLNELLTVCQSSVRFILDPNVMKLIFALLQNSRFKSRLAECLKNMILVEAGEGNESRFVFWKLFKELLKALRDKDDEHIEPIIKYLLELYAKIPLPNSTKEKTSKSLQNKLILFVADLMESGFLELNANMILTIKIILNRCLRKFDKFTLIKLRAVFQDHYSEISEQHKTFKKNEHVQAVRKKLEKISKPVAAKKNEKEAEEEEQEDDISDQENNNRTNTNNRTNSNQNSNSRGTRNRGRSNNKSNRSSRSSNRKSEKSQSPESDQEKSEDDLELGRKPDPRRMQTRRSELKSNLADIKPKRGVSKSKPKKKS